MKPPFGREDVVLPLLLRRRAAELPDHEFLRDVTGRSFTFAQLHERALLWARALMAAGVQPGQTVVTMVHNRVENYAIWLGISWAGGIEVPINVGLHGTVLTHQLVVAGAELALVDAAAAPAVQQAARGVSSLRRVVVLEPWHGDDPELTTIAVDDLLSGAPEQPPRPYAEPQMWDIASVIYTSGTTGPSKGVLMPWGQLHAGQLLTAASVADGPSATKVMYVCGPPNHVQSKGAIAAMAMLGGTVVVRHAFSGSHFWEEVERYQVSDAGLIGSMAQFLLAAPPGPDDAGTPLTNVLMAPVVPAVDEFNARFGTRVWSAYNMTEISVPTWLREWERGDSPTCGPARDGYPFYELRLVDEHDIEVGAGEVGELILRTQVAWTMNAGYLNDPGATASAWRNGWFHTGDGFRLDDRGRYVFVDRMKDTIRRRGENISSYEVEAEAVMHAAVLECAAVAVPADEAEDEIKLVVVPHEGVSLTAEELIAFLTPRLPSFMLPRYVQLVPRLPKTPTLRVQKSLVSRSVDPAEGVHDRTVSPARRP